MIVWCVRKQKTRVVCTTFRDAWEDWKSHEGEFRLIYPRIMSSKAFFNLKEFDGW